MTQFFYSFFSICLRSVCELSKPSHYTLLKDCVKFEAQNFGPMFLQDCLFLLKVPQWQSKLFNNLCRWMLSFDKMEMRHSKKEKKCGFLWQPSIFIKKMENCKYVDQIATHTLDWFWLEIACYRSRQVKYRDILCQANFKEVTFQKGTSWPTCWMQKSESLPTPDMVREASRPTNERGTKDTCIL